jgi:ribonucleoside-diphosphate reductase alpha chain
MSKFDVFSNKFAQDIFLQKYSQNGQESWEQTCRRVVEAVCNQLVNQQTKEKIFNLMLERKFIPGGRYLYSAGRPFHQVNNCLAGSERIITSTGIFSLRELAGEVVKVRNRFGEWEYASIKSFGTQRLLKITFDNKDEILATENHRWWQEDGTRVTTSNLKRVPQSFAASDIDLDKTGIQHGIIFGDGYLNTHTDHCEIVLVNEKKDGCLANYFEEKDVLVKGRYDNLRSFPSKRRVKAGMKIGFLPNTWKQFPESCTPEYARGFIAGLIATDGHVAKKGSVTIACEGKDKSRKIAELAVLGGCVVNSIYLSSNVNPFNGEPRELYFVSIKPFSAPIILDSHKENCEDRKFYKREMFLNVTSIEDTGIDEEVYCAVVPHSESFTLANGLITSNCFLFRAEDSREGWAEATYKATSALMTGGGIGFDYSALREAGALIKRTGGTSTGPLALMNIINELGRYVMQGGQRRSAIYGSLNWKHGDIQDFMNSKNHSPELRAAKEKDFMFPLPLELTNISVNYDTEFFVAIEDENHPNHQKAMATYLQNCKQAFSTAEPGMSFNFLKDNETLRNACCEVVSEDDSDKCNLGTLWINRFKNRKEFSEAIKYSTIFLLCGGIYSDIPNDKIRDVGAKNNRIGLGLGGIHEWLLVRGEKYEVTQELHKWLNVYEMESNSAAFIYAKELGVAVPKGVRAIAPTGTIGIIAETTTGIEPLFCKAYKRRYFKDGKWLSQFVIDGAVKRLLDKGVAIENIQDSYDISFKERVKFQADVQNYVDMAISSTCNIAQWGSETNNENTVKENAELLLKYAKRLRGFTVYPDSCRGGQPLTRVSLAEALEKEGTVFEEQERECLNGVCGL